MTVHFVEIGRIVDHHYLKCIFLMLLVISMSCVIMISNIIENIKSELNLTSGNNVVDICDICEGYNSKNVNLESRSQ